MGHPLYDDETVVARETRKHLAAGRSVFQMFQLAGNERAHSTRVLDMLKLRHSSRVLSLGCGVGGMERYWHELRPDLQFTLVNNSQAQLDLCQCPGRKVLADAAHYIPAPRQRAHCVVLAYVLGHVPVETTLETAMCCVLRGGTVVVLDVFDTSAKFDEAFHYSAPTDAQMHRWCFWRPSLVDQWQLTPWMQTEAPWVLGNATPGLYLNHG